MLKKDYLKADSKFIVFIYLLQFFLFTPALLAQNNNYYERCLERLESGRMMAAVNIWMQGKTMLQEEGKTDPRIGIKFIETVTKNKLKNLYERACEFYMWGFSKDNFNEYSDVYLEEAERVIPVLYIEDAKIWKEDLKNKDSILIKKIREFWIQKDPTPATPNNEKLIEHWKRIEYSRNNFKLNTYSPYKTDDRGTIYVKYGEPFLKKSGTFGQKLNPSTMNTHGAKVAKYHRYPQYEVWMYFKLWEDDRVYYFFGAPAGKRYGLLDGIEDFIENATFSNNNLTFNTYVGTTIQEHYYGDMLVFGGEFAERLHELQGANNSNVARGLRTKWKNRDKQNPLKLYAPGEVTNTTEYVIPIDIVYSSARLLNADNSPQLSVVSMAYPTGAGENYTLDNILIRLNSDWTEVERFTDFPVNQYDNTSTFLIEHSDSTLNYILTAEAMPERLNYTVTSSNDTVMMKFAGKEILEKKRPLSTDPSILEVSDLITGIDIPPNANLKEYPFPVLPARELSKGDSLQVYFEVYHLSLNPGGNANYEVQFIVSRLPEKSFVNMLLGKRNPEEIITQTYTFSSNSTISKEKATFDISVLKEGKYEFIVEIKDLISNQIKIREGKFRITK
ncbi:MAG: GWxTD domain-containing protein [bacterium]|nr:GWxTD domain-containing protein [bacterium]